MVQQNQHKTGPANECTTIDGKGKVSFISVCVMYVVKEFKEFISRGNVVDLAVGVIIGGAFGKIVTSLVNDIIMPPLGLLLGGINFTGLRLILKQPANDPVTGKPIDALALNYGTFIQTGIDFIIIAFAIFIFVKIFNSMKRKETAPPPAPPTKEELLLTEIRDLIKQQKSDIKPGNKS